MTGINVLRRTARMCHRHAKHDFASFGSCGSDRFYIQNYQRMINRRRLQKDDPPPDLAIECDVTSKTTIEAYKAIEVPEVWIFDSGKLHIYLFQHKEYVESEYSLLFPQIALTQIIPNAVERSWQIGSVAALEELKAKSKAL